MINKTLRVRPFLFQIQPIGDWAIRSESEKALHKSGEFELVRKEEKPLFASHDPAGGQLSECLTKHTRLTDRERTSPPGHAGRRLLKFKSVSGVLGGGRGGIEELAAFKLPLSLAERSGIGYRLDASARPAETWETEFKKWALELSACTVISWFWSPAKLLWDLWRPSEIWMHSCRCVILRNKFVRDSQVELGVELCSIEYLWFIVAKFEVWKPQIRRFWEVFRGVYGRSHTLPFKLWSVTWIRNPLEYSASFNQPSQKILVFGCVISQIIQNWLIIDHIHCTCIKVQACTLNTDLLFRINRYFVISESCLSIWKGQYRLLLMFCGLKFIMYYSLIHETKWLLFTVKSCRNKITGVFTGVQVES